MFIAGLHCSVGGCNPAGDGPLNAAEILPHYNVPLPPIPDGESDDEDGATVAVFDAALSDDIFASVQHGFRSDSTYWGRGGGEYSGDFYSHWYDLKEKPINSVQQAIQQLAMRIPPSDRKLIRGVEWWAHKRPFGDASAHPQSVEGRRYTRSYYHYHNLHFDLDDVVLDSDDTFIHPLYGSALYLTVEGAGPTIVLEQTTDQLAWRERNPSHPRHYPGHAIAPRDTPAVVNGSMITPQQGAYARWRGNRLHAVSAHATHPLPPSPPPQLDVQGCLF